MDDGVIKFQLKWTEGPAPVFTEVKELIRWRDKMFALGLIGFDEQHGVGFGNISMLPAGQNKNFVISGTQTGHLPHLQAEHFTEVTDYDIAGNHLTCCGPVKASSESLTHAAIYEADPEIRAVIHIHHDQQWEHWLNSVPTTDATVPYGTPEMAAEIHRLLSEMQQPEVIAMAGHQGGLIAFGKTLEAAAAPFLDI
jgi:ribulose-5-phosphate 4-epimerase/fuculose-1-phosphate aldolase